MHVVQPYHSGGLAWFSAFYKSVFAAKVRAQVHSIKHVFLKSHFYAQTTVSIVSLDHFARRPSRPKSLNTSQITPIPTKRALHSRIYHSHLSISLEQDVPPSPRSSHVSQSTRNLSGPPLRQMRRQVSDLRLLRTTYNSGSDLRRMFVRKLPKQVHCMWW